MKFSTRVVQASKACDTHTHNTYTKTSLPATSVTTHKMFAEDRKVLEATLASLENAQYAVTTMVGMTIVDRVMKLLRPGDKVLVIDHVCQDIYCAFEETYQPHGIQFDYLPADIAVIQKVLSSSVRLLWVTTPSHLTTMTDIAHIAEITQNMGIHVVVDSTLSSPYLQTPLDNGADIVLHTAAKYLTGHADIVMGAAMTNDKELHESMSFPEQTDHAEHTAQKETECLIVRKSLQTLPLRMQQHVENAGMVATFLQEHPKVNKVFYPGFSAHAHHQIAQKQMKGYGGMVAFTLTKDSPQEAMRVLKRLQLFSVSMSCGGAESSACHVMSMPYHMNKKIPKTKDLTPSMLCVSVGIEDITDILKDLEQAVR